MARDLPLFLALRQQTADGFQEAPVRLIPKRSPTVKTRGSARTAPADLKRINSMFNAMSDLLGYLHARWQDESEYENIAEYAKAVRKNLPKGFKLLRMMKRPFGFQFSIGTPAVYRMTATNNAAEWLRLF